MIIFDNQDLHSSQETSHIPCFRVISAKLFANKATDDNERSLGPHSNLERKQQVDTIRTFTFNEHGNSAQSVHFHWYPQKMLKKLKNGCLILKALTLT